MLQAFTKAFHLFVRARSQPFQPILDRQVNLLLIEGHILSEIGVVEVNMNRKKRKYNAQCIRGMVQVGEAIGSSSVAVLAAARRESMGSTPLHRFGF